VIFCLPAENSLRNRVQDIGCRYITGPSVQPHPMYRSQGYYLLLRAQDGRF